MFSTPHSNEFAVPTGNLPSLLSLKTTYAMESLIIRVYAVVMRNRRTKTMPKWGYSIQNELLDPETTVKASARELRVSHKHAREVCRTIKGMTLTQAKTYLQDVMEKKKAVPFRRYQKKAGHRKGLENDFAGRYPIKTAAKLFKLLQAAEANAQHKNLDTQNLKITHAAAYPGMKMKRYTPRAHGRASPKYDTTTHIELALTQIQQTGETT